MRRSQRRHGESRPLLFYSLHFRLFVLDEFGFFPSSSSSLCLSSISTMVGDIYFLSWLQLIIIICCRCVAVRAGATHLSSVSSDDGKAYSCSIIYILYILLRRYTSYYAFCFGVSFSLQGEDPFRLL